MTTWIHFTKDAREFELTRQGGDSISQEFDGLFVYKFTDEYPIEQRRRDWANRDVIFVSCDVELVELVQRDPIGSDSSRDEYVIPSKHFDKCNWWTD